MLKSVLNCRFGELWRREKQHNSDLDFLTCLIIVSWGLLWKTDTACLVNLPVDSSLYHRSHRCFLFCRHDVKTIGNFQRLQSHLTNFTVCWTSPLLVVFWVLLRNTNKERHQSTEQTHQVTGQHALNLPHETASVKKVKQFLESDHLGLGHKLFAGTRMLSSFWPALQNQFQKVSSDN